MGSLIGAMFFSLPLQNNATLLNCIRILCFASLLLIPIGQAKADIRAEVVTDWLGAKVFVAIVSGEIMQKDAEELLSRGEEAAAAESRVVVLNSTGGNLNAALSMGRQFRKMNFDAFLLHDAVCYSACVFILASAIDKTVKGNVGIHRPYFLASGTGSIADEIKELKSRAEEYLEEMNIPVRLVEDMFSVEPSSMRILTNEELSNYRLNSKDFVAQEAETVRRMERYGKTRAEYEAFTQDLNYSCQIYMGDQVRFDECSSKVAKHHGIK